MLTSDRRRGGLPLGIGIGFSGNSGGGGRGGNSLSPFGAALSSATECAWRPQCDPLGQLAPLSGLIHLTLVDCAALRAVRCHCPIVPLLSDGDANLFGQAAEEELQRRRPGLMVQLD